MNNDYDNLVDRLRDLSAYSPPSRSAPNEEWVELINDLQADAEDADEDIADEFHDLIDDISYFMESRGG